MKSKAYRTADYLKTRKDIVAYLNAALEDGHPSVLLETLRNAAQARGGSAGWRSKQLKAKFKTLQAYGATRAAGAGITEKDIARLVFGGR